MEASATAWVFVRVQLDSLDQIALSTAAIVLFAATEEHVSTGPASVHRNLPGHRVTAFNAPVYATVL